MDYQALRDEVLNDPAHKGYGAHLSESPGIVVEMLNGYTEQMVKPIATTKAMVWAAAGPYARIIDASNNQSHPCRASCLVIRETFAAGLDIHLDDPEISGMFSAWVQAGLISQDEHDALMATAAQPASRAEIIGCGMVTEADLRTALAS